MQTPTPYLIFTHNNRIQCLLASFGIKPANKVRFKNCAIVKLDINPIQETGKAKVEIDLVYEGELSGSDLKK